MTGVSVAFIIIFHICFDHNVFF